MNMFAANTLKKILGLPYFFISTSRKILQFLKIKSEFNLFINNL